MGSVHGHTNRRHAWPSRPLILDRERLRVIFHYTALIFEVLEDAPLAVRHRGLGVRIESHGSDNFFGRGVNHRQVHPVAVVHEDVLGERVVDQRVSIDAVRLDRRGKFERLQIKNVDCALLFRLVARHKRAVELWRHGNPMQPVHPRDVADDFSRVLINHYDVRTPGDVNAPRICIYRNIVPVAFAAQMDSSDHPIARILRSGRNNDRKK